MDVWMNVMFEEWTGDTDRGATDWARAGGEQRHSGGAVHVELSLKAEPELPSRQESEGSASWVGGADVETQRHEEGVLDTAGVRSPG